MTQTPYYLHVSELYVYKQFGSINYATCLSWMPKQETFQHLYSLLSTRDFLY